MFRFRLVALRFVAPRNRNKLRRKEGENGLTLTELAKNYHVSAQALRNRVQRAGYSLDEIREPGSNKLSAKGERIIKELFAAAPANKKQAKGSTEGKDGNQGGKATGSGNALAVIRAERDELKIRTATAETLAEERKRTIEFLQEQIRQKDETISKLAAAAAVKAALPEPAPAQDPGTDNRRRLFSWFRKQKK